MNYPTGRGFKRRYRCLVAVENVGSALCCPGRQEVLLKQQDPPEACSPSPTCCAVRACGTCKCIMTEMKGQGRTTAHGRVGLNFDPGEGQPGLVLQQCMVVVSIILTGLEQPHPFKGCLDHVGSKIMLTLP